ncbi:MAG: hypothetical protein HFE72_00940 [Emergencia sp.]|nr:hypothetical protein [Emergencia sp.]
MKHFGKKSRALICLMVVLSLLLIPTSVFAGKHREWTRVRDWTTILDAYEEDWDTINIGSEGKITIECWQELYSSGEDAQMGPYQLKLSLQGGNYEKFYMVDTSDDGTNTYHRTFELTGLPKGDYRIMVKPQTKVRFHFRADTYRSIYKEPTYKEMTTLAKSLATKNIKYKNEDIGEHARLYGKRVEVPLGLAKSEDCLMGTTFQPYIDIQKDGKTAKLSLRVKGTAQYVDLWGDYLYYDSIRFYTSSRTTTFDIGYDDVHGYYSYRKGLYFRTNYWSATLSSNTKRRDAQIDKLIKIFKQKNVKVRIYHYENGNYIWGKLSDGERKNWLAVFQKYKKMLKEYE